VSLNNAEKFMGDFKQLNVKTSTKERNLNLHRINISNFSRAFSSRLKSTILTTSHFIRKPIRDLSFWRQAIHIYSSYKFLQAHNLIKRKFSKKFDEDEYENAWAYHHEINSNRMMRLCLSLKGFYLKTGQFLGTRYDFMPSKYTEKLGKLHDDVPPLSEAEAKRILENELNGPIEKFFSHINLSCPIGSASVAQVHLGIWRSTGLCYEL
jgi:predicted unusual protein kinase regulating ubiquinone biosynthesis (AarF/ABC1/UbiB family)